MSRSFSPSAGTDSITFSAGNAPPDQGPITIAVLAKLGTASSFTGYLVNGRTSGSVWALLTSNNPDQRLFCENDFGSGVSGFANGVWKWFVITKASGSVLPRMHVWDLSSAWSHTNDTSNVGDGAGPITSLVVGGPGTGSTGWRGSIAVVAAWDTALSDGTIETTMTLKASDVLAGSPKWMIRLNQASTGTSVSDDTGGGGNQTALSGTTVDADDPPGFNYSLSGAQNVAPAGVAVPVAVGSPSVSGTLAVAPSGIAVPVAVGQPSLSMLGGTVNAAGIAVPATLGAPSVIGQPYVAPLQSGSWWTLETILDTTRSQIDWWNKRQPVACPNDGEPLRRSVDGILFCPFDNWRPDRQQAVPRRRAVNRDWGHLSGIKQAAARDAAFNQLVLSCPNDGEPLSIGKHGEQFCRYDGWMPDPVS